MSNNRGLEPAPKKQKQRIANIEAGPVLPFEGRKVWPRKGYSTPTDAEKSGEPYRPVRKA